MPKATEFASNELPFRGEVQETLRWLTERLRKLYSSRLKRLILFGSPARGEAPPESDVDLLVVLDEPISPSAEAKRTSPGGNPFGPLPRHGLFFHSDKRRGVRRGLPSARSVCSRGVFPESPSPVNSTEEGKGKPDTTPDRSSRGGKNAPSKRRSLD